MENLSEAVVEHKPRGVPGAPQLAPYRWKKGETGNPGGRSEGQKQCLALAREASPKAMAALIALLDSADDRVVLMAADKVLERAYGKAKEAPEDPRPPIDLSKLPPEALAMLKAALGLIAGGVPKQEVIPPETTPTTD